MDDKAATIWIDVEDLFDYARRKSRPGGIQRLAFEIFRVLHRRYGDKGRVRFVRHDPMRNSLAIVSWDEVAGLFSGLIDVDLPHAAASVPPELPPDSGMRQFARVWVYRLPVELRTRAIEALLAQSRALRAWARLLAWVPSALARRRHAPSAERPAAQPVTDRFEALAAPGDMLMALGSPWSHPNYAAVVHAQKDRFGLRFAMLVYDIIPLRRPEWFDRGLIRLFRAWLESTLPLADRVFAISRATAADVEAYAAARGIVLSGPVQPIPIGTGFGDGAAPAVRTARLPAPGTYALFVSTIEARKNHLLLFRIWRRLLDEMPPDAVPTLVFAGAIGWLVDDLMQQIVNTDHLDGKLVLVLDPTDAELSALYENCLFTLYPSFYEGWGLPVSESFAFGKPCIMADRTSLPEAGGALARRFDPDDLNDAHRVIRDTIQDRAGLAAWQERVRREFVPVPWTATVDALLDGLDRPT